MDRPAAGLREPTVPAPRRHLPRPRGLPAGLPPPRRAALLRRAPAPRRAARGGGRGGSSEGTPGLRAVGSRPVRPLLAREPTCRGRRPSALLLGVCCGNLPQAPAPPPPPQAAAISAPPHGTGTREGWGRAGQGRARLPSRSGGAGPGLPCPPSPAPSRSGRSAPAEEAPRRPPVSRRDGPFPTAGGERLMFEGKTTALRTMVKYVVFGPSLHTRPLSLREVKRPRAREVSACR